MFLDERETKIKRRSGKEGVARNDEDRGVLDLEQTRMLFRNIVPKLCVNMRPMDLNAALLMELLKASPSRGGKQIRLWDLALFKHNRNARPQVIEVSLPRELKNGNAEQREKNPNLCNFHVLEHTPLHKLLLLVCKFRGPGVTSTALFLHPCPDNEWRVSL